MREINKCYLCNGKKILARQGTVRDNPNLKVLECEKCGLVFLSSFDHIKDDFYKNAEMHGSNPDINLDEWIKETKADDERRFKALGSKLKEKTILDVGCGTGGFLSLSKKIAKEVAGVEPEERLKPHFKKQGITVFSEISEVKNKYDVITLFHVLEHIDDPILFLKKIGKLLKRNGQLIVEVPNSNDALLSIYKNKSFSEFTYWSCHLFLYNQHTLRLIAEKAGLKTVYIKQIQRYNLSNHLYWLAFSKPGGHKVWSFLNSAELDSAYQKSLSGMGSCDTIEANFKIA